MISIAMQLGHAPIPPKTATGRKHIPEGCSEVRSGGSLADITKKAAARREYIASELAISGPMTEAEISEFTGANKNTSAEDMKVLVKSERVKKRLHKAENIYWSAA